jgi:hypothetical protein
MKGSQKSYRIGDFVGESREIEGLRGSGRDGGIGNEISGERGKIEKA